MSGRNISPRLWEKTAVMPRKNIGAKPYIVPMPVFIISSYDEAGKPCAMLAVWGGISGEKEITVTVAS